MSGKSRQHKTWIDVSDVIADHEHWPARSAEILSSFNSGPSQEKYRGTQQQVVHEQANPGDRPALCPTRIVVRRSRRKLALQHALQFADCVYGGEAGLAEIDLVAVLERA